MAVAVVFALWSRTSVPDALGRGSVAPEFALRQSGTDREVRLSSLHGRVVLLNFWATWCKPCEDEMPAMQRLYTALGPEGLELLAVSVDDSPEVVEEFRKRLALTFPLLLDPDKRVAAIYQTFRFPETLLIDRDGVVLERYVGPKEWDASLYQARLRRLLTGEAG